MKNFTIQIVFVAKITAADRVKSRGTKFFEELCSCLAYKLRHSFAENFTTGRKRGIDHAISPKGISL